MLRCPFDEAYYITIIVFTHTHIQYVCLFECSTEHQGLYDVKRINLEGGFCSLFSEDIHIYIDEWLSNTKKTFCKYLHYWMLSELQKRTWNSREITSICVILVIDKGTYSSIISQHPSTRQGVWLCVNMYVCICVFACMWEINHWS